jgi:uncharacterized RDD family membrane protein YckC
LLWFDALAALGSPARLIGGTIAFGYFAVLNSRVAGGQTIGKRALSIRVARAQGAAVGIARSSIRAFILVLPITLNGITFASSDGGHLVSIALAVCIFGLGGALVYLYIFNGRTRQSLHDLAAGTFVVNAKADGPIHARIWQPHLAIAAVWILVVAVGLGPLSNLAGRSDTLQGLQEIQRVAQSVVPGAELTAQKGVSAVTSTKSGVSSAEFLQIRVHPRQRPSSHEEIANQIAAALLAECPEARAVDRLIISITFGYDIMISTMSTTQNFSHSPKEWAERLDVASPENSAA